MRILKYKKYVLMWKKIIKYSIILKAKGRCKKVKKIKINQQKAAIGNTEKQLKNYTSQLDDLKSESGNAESESEELDILMVRPTYIFSNFA